ncbi:MAG: cation:proton antiporter [Promethearchaeota archaeon]
MAKTKIFKNVCEILMFASVSSLAIATIIIEIGVLLVFSLATAYILKRLGIPAVLGFILGGLVIGFFTGISSYAFSPELELIQNLIVELALAWIGYSIGSEIDLDLLRNNGKKYGLLLIGEAVGAFVVVILGIFLFVQNFSLAFILGAIAVTTAPVSVVEVLGEYKAKGEFSRTLLFILAFDDILAILLVNIALNSTAGGSGSETGLVLLLYIIFSLVQEIIVSMVFGAGAAGIILALSSQLALKDKSIYEWVIGVTFASVGLALLLSGSTLLTMFIFGMILKTQDKCGDCREAVHTVEILFVPIVILFFVLVGLEMDLGLIFGAGGLVFIALVYFILRIVGKTIGISLTGVLSETDPCIWKNLPLGLVPQAGIAIGLAGLAFNRLTSLGQVDSANLIINVIGVVVLIGEIVGPLAIKKAIFRTGEAFQDQEEKEPS